MNCEVCGDVAKSKHFGATTCDSCKAFFRRAVQSKNYKDAVCYSGNICEIGITTRKTCAVCRYNKCISVGMEPSWVMSEEERSEMNKQRIEKKQQKVTSDSEKPSCSYASTSSSSDKSESMSMDPWERHQIESIIGSYVESYNEIPYQVPLHPEDRTPTEVIHMFTTIIRRLTSFALKINEFNRLVLGDREILLRLGILEICFLRSVAAHDPINNRWPIPESLASLVNCPQLNVSDLKKFMPENLYDMLTKFISSMTALKIDEMSIMLLTLIVLFSPERQGLIDTTTVNLVQEKYTGLLQKHVTCHFGSDGKKMFPKILAKLIDLRELSDYNRSYNLRLSESERSEVQRQLGQLLADIANNQTEEASNIAK